LGVPGGVVGIEVTHKEVGGASRGSGSCQRCSLSAVIVAEPTYALVTIRGAGSESSARERNSRVRVSSSSVSRWRESVRWAYRSLTRIATPPPDWRASRGARTVSYPGMRGGGPLRGGAGLLEQEKVHRGLVLGSYVPQHSQRGSRGAVDVQLERL